MSHQTTLQALKRRDILISTLRIYPNLSDVWSKRTHSIWKSKHSSKNLPRVWKFNRNLLDNFRNSCNGTRVGHLQLYSGQRLGPQKYTDQQYHPEGNSNDLVRNLRTQFKIHAQPLPPSFPCLTLCRMKEVTVCTVQERSNTVDCT